MRPRDEDTVGRLRRSFDRLTGDLELPASLSRAAFESGLSRALMPERDNTQDRARLQKARDLLSTGNLSITEVASQVGFDSVSRFRYWFRRRTGLAPLAYRRRLVTRLGKRANLPA